MGLLDSWFSSPLDPSVWANWPRFTGGLLEQGSGGAVPYNRPANARQSQNVSVYHWSNDPVSAFNAMLSGQTPMPGIDYPARRYAPAVYQGRLIMPPVPQQVPGQQPNIAAILQSLFGSGIQPAQQFGAQFQPASRAGRFMSGLGFY
jgi:hypothetical protein